MGLFSNLFSMKPSYVSDIIKIIEGYFVDVNPEVGAILKKEAIFYAENPNNKTKIEAGYANDKTSEYFALMFIYLGAKDAVLRGDFHQYAGIISAEGMIACEIIYDALDRLAQRVYINSEEAEQMKERIQEKVNDVGIG